MRWQPASATTTAVFDDKKKPPVKDRSWRPLAVQVRLEYIRRKSQLLKAAYKLPTRNDALEHWENPSRLCAECNMQPGPFVDLLFLMWPDKLGPMPNALSGHTARGIVSTARSAYVEPQQVAGPMEATHIVQSSLLDLLKLQWVTLKLRAGTVMTGDPRVTLCLRDYTEDLAPWFRVLVAGDDPEVWRLFSCPAQHAINTNPPLRKLLESACMPVAQMLAKPAAPPPAWMMDMIKEEASPHHG